MRSTGNSDPSPSRRASLSVFLAFPLPLRLHHPSLRSVLVGKPLSCPLQGPSEVHYPQYPTNISRRTAGKGTSAGKVLAPAPSLLVPSAPFLVFNRSATKSVSKRRAGIPGTAINLSNGIRELQLAKRAQIVSTFTFPRSTLCDQVSESK